MNYDIREIREVDIPQGPWPYVTMSYGCSGDCKGRSMMVLVGDGSISKFAGKRGNGEPITEELSTQFQNSIINYFEKEDSSQP